MILNGRDIFNLMDSQGIPFELICSILREKNIGFDIKQFAIAAYNSGNYTYDSLKKLLLREAKTKSAKELIDNLFY